MIHVKRDPHLRFITVGLGFDGGDAVKRSGVVSERERVKIF